MNIIVERKVFQSQVGPMAKVKGDMVIKANWNTGTVEILAHDFNRPNCHKIISTDMACQVLEGGLVSFDVKAFFKSLKSCDGDYIQLVDDKDRKLHINGYSFQAIQNLSWDISEGKIPTNLDYVASIDFKEFKAALKKILPAASTDITRPVLQSVYMELLGNFNMALTTLDGFRCATVNMKYLAANDKGNYIIPSELLKILLSGSIKAGTIEVYSDNKFIEFRVGDMRFCDKLLDGEYICYEQLFYKKPTTTATVNVNDLKVALKDLKNKKSKIVKLNLADNNILLQSNGNETNIECILNGDKLEIAFNIEYLLDGLKHITGDTINMAFTTNIRQVIIHAAAGYRYVLLPVRLASAA